MAGQIKLSSSAPAVGIARAKNSWPAVRVERIGRLANLEWSIVATLAIFVVLGFGLRAGSLDAIGFAEDEMNKLDAVRAYEQGDITANAEHPMLMKVLMYVSIKATGAWQRVTGTTVSNEFALRVPNAIFGALTVIPLFLLTAAYLDRWIGLWAAGFWAFGINAIALNRIGKEDTLLVFFMLFAFYFYVRAKKTTPRDMPRRRRNYIWSAFSFGLMLASKYFPHYFGLNALFHHIFHVRKAEPGEPSGKTPTLFYLLIPISFLIANPAVFLPKVWEYLNAYMGERLLVHTGYLFGDQLYLNNMSSTPFWGTPVYFYALFLAIKVPLLVLAVFVVGVVVSVKRRRDPGYAFAVFMFLWWIVPYSLIGGKWLRYTLSLLPYVYILAAVGTVTLTGIATSLVRASENVREKTRGLVTVFAVLIFIVWPAWIAYANGPHYGLYTNALGAGRAGYFFPHDEFYDDGLREAIKFVCDVAPENALIAHETPAVTRYYLKEFGRQDLQSRAISAADFDPANLSITGYVVVQRGRTYFENQEKISFVRVNYNKVHEVSIKGLIAAEVFVNDAGSRPRDNIKGRFLSDF